MPPINRMGLISATSDIFEEARRQDEERAIRRDEEYFRLTGENVAFSERPPSVVVPLTPADEDPPFEQSRQYKAMEHRETIIVQKAVEENTPRWKNPILSLSLDDDPK